MTSHGTSQYLVTIRRHNISSTIWRQIVLRLFGHLCWVLLTQCSSVTRVTSSWDCCLYMLSQKTRKLCYRKDAPWVLWKLSRLLDYAHGYFSPKFSWAFVSIDRMNVCTKLKSVALPVPEIIGGNLCKSYRTSCKIYRCCDSLLLLV